MRMNERQRDELVSFLRRLLNDLEAGKVVRVALDLQALVRELEEEARASTAQSPSDASEALTPEDPDGVPGEC
jgi:hypothetical protein